MNVYTEVRTMAKYFNTDDVGGPRGHELRAAFGEDTEMVELEPDDLESVETPEYPIRHALKEGDWITIQHKSGCVTTGPVEEVNRVGCIIDPRNRATDGYVSYGDLERYKDDDLGVVNTLIDINGEQADCVLDRRLGDN